MIIRTKDILIHSTCWLLYFATLVLSTTKWDAEFWTYLIGNNLPVIILFYANLLFIFPKYLGRKRYFPLFFWLLLFNALVIVLRFLFILLLQQGYITDMLDAQLGPRIVGLVRGNLLFTGVSLAYWYGKRSIAIERNQQRLEREISEAQLMLLKNQINPHFLYNTLSFLYTKALPLSKDLSDAIAKLSEMMRYSLGEIGKDDKVPLEKEIAHLDNFIGIHQLRFNRELCINFTVEGDPKCHKVMPLLLITFVENAFKHGIVHDETMPLNIHLKMSRKSLHFRVQNKKSNGLKEKSSGIGLKNIRSRLAVAYPETHSLEINDNSEEYIVNLILKTT